MFYIRMRALVAGEIYSEAWASTISGRAAAKFGGGYHFEGNEEQTGVYAGVSLETNKGDVGTISVGFGGAGISKAISYHTGHTDREEKGEANIDDNGIIPAGSAYVYNISAFDLEGHVVGADALPEPKNAMGAVQSSIEGEGGDEMFDGGQLQFILTTHCND